jgi:hypothetical protein
MGTPFFEILYRVPTLRGDALAKRKKEHMERRKAEAEVKKGRSLNVCPYGCPWVHP